MTLPLHKPVKATIEAGISSHVESLVVFSKSEDYALSTRREGSAGGTISSRGSRETEGYALETIDPTSGKVLGSSSNFRLDHKRPVHRDRAGGVTMAGRGENYTQLWLGHDAGVPWAVQESLALEDGRGDKLRSVHSLEKVGSHYQLGVVSSPVGQETGSEADLGVNYSPVNGTLLRDVRMGQSVTLDRLEVAGARYVVTASDSTLTIARGDGKVVGSHALGMPLLLYGLVSVGDSIGKSVFLRGWLGPEDATCWAQLFTTAGALGNPTQIYPLGRPTSYRGSLSFDEVLNRQYVGGHFPNKVLALPRTTPLRPTQVILRREGTASQVADRRGVTLLREASGAVDECVLFNPPNALLTSLDQRVKYDGAVYKVVGYIQKRQGQIRVFLELAL